MSIIFNYLNYYVYGIEAENEPKNENTEVIITSENEGFEKIEVSKKNLISINDLKSINLQPVDNIIPGPSRNAPPKFSKVDLSNLNKAQLNQILDVKLKPTPVVERQKIFPPRNKVIYELYNKFNSQPHN